MGELGLWVRWEPAAPIAASAWLKAVQASSLTPETHLCHHCRQLGEAAGELELGSPLHCGSPKLPRAPRHIVGAL